MCFIQKYLSCSILYAFAVVILQGGKRDIEDIEAKDINSGWRNGDYDPAIQIVGS